MAFLSEAAVESAMLEQLKGLGYEVALEDVIGPDGSKHERDNHSEVILKPRLREAIARINPDMPIEAQENAVRMVTTTVFPHLIEENRRIHKLLTEGVDVEYAAADGTTKSGKVNLIDFDNLANNDWLVVNQFVVIAGQYNRRPDVVVFVNGLPLAVIELKAPGSDSATLLNAFNQLQTYKLQIPALFHTNAVLVMSDGMSARVGSLSSDLERFMPWRTTDGAKLAGKGQPELMTLVEGVFERSRFLQILQNFTVFATKNSGLVKVIAGYHQFHAVNHAVEATVKASQPTGDRKVGVVWHTQGSGKSLLMAFYAGRLVKHPAMQNPTLVILTDRNDLDDQLFATFSTCQDLIRQRPEQANSREDLQHILSRASGGVVFTTIQKFSPVEAGGAYPALTDRRNVVVIADEAHRSQYGLKAKVDLKTGSIGYGFAKHLRDALPNASFIGFTGTPIEAADINTPAVFGEYIDVYDISRAVEDGATVPIYYESRLARIKLDEDDKATLDEEILSLTEDESEEDREDLKSKWSKVEAVVGSKKRIELVASDLVSHLEARLVGLTGKAMAVCMSRRICIKLHDAIVKLRPDWYSKDDAAGRIKIVMTGAASDPVEWQEHIGNKSRRDNLAKRARNPEDPLTLVLVCDMWLTGFDAPCMHTMYIDKPMQGHGLMQAIARVNRVFKDKPGGLIVDFIGIAQSLKLALQQYSANDRDKTGIDEREAVAVMLEKYEVVRDMFHGFDYKSALKGTEQERLVMMAGAIEWVLNFQQKLAESEKTDEGKKKAHRRYQDAVLALSKAYSLSSASNEAKKIREEVGFFQTIRGALVKTTTGSGVSQYERDFAVQQIVDRSIQSAGIVDILGAMGIGRPDISILSDEFLTELQRMNKRNFALEALKKLLADGIFSRSRVNIVETRAFTERLENAVARYHANAITTAQALQELIKLAQDIRAAQARGEESGLTEDEIAFYDALAENKSAVDVLGDDKLKLIAHEVLNSLRQNISVDWAEREGVRARLRLLVKRILKKHGYPPDLQDQAVKTVLQQAEVWNIAQIESMQL